MVLYLVIVLVSESENHISTNVTYEFNISNDFNHKEANVYLAFQPPPNALNKFTTAILFSLLTIDSLNCADKRLFCWLNLILKDFLKFWKLI